MARGGSRGRRTSYVRDNSGRFASSPGGGPPKRSTPATRRAAMRKARPTVTGGTLGARGSLRRSRAKLASKNPADRSLQGSLSLRAQKGAVTRGVNRLGKVRAASTVRMAGKGPAGVIRGGRKVAAGPAAAPKSSVRVIRPNRPARRPLAKPEYGKVGDYVQAVRGSRQALKAAKPGTAAAREARQGYDANRKALSQRIQRERGARRGLKPATSRQVLTGTVPAPPARRVKAPRPSGTIAKPRGLKPGAITARKAKAAAKPAAPQGPKLLPPAAAKLAAAKRIKGARPAGTVVKPRGLKPGAIAARRKAKQAASKPVKAKAAPGKQKSTYGAMQRARQNLSNAESSYLIAARTAIEGKTQAQKMKGALLAIRARKAANRAVAAINIYNGLFTPQVQGEWITKIRNDIRKGGTAAARFYQSYGGKSGRSGYFW